MIRRGFVCLSAGALSLLALSAVTADDAEARRIGPTFRPNVIKVRPLGVHKQFRVQKFQKLGPGSRKFVQPHKLMKGSLHAGPHKLTAHISPHKLLLPQRLRVNTLFWRGQGVSRLQYKVLGDRRVRLVNQAWKLPPAGHQLHAHTWNVWRRPWRSYVLVASTGVVLWSFGCPLDVCDSIVAACRSGNYDAAVGLLQSAVAEDGGPAVVADGDRRTVVVEEDRGPAVADDDRGPAVADDGGASAVAAGAQMDDQQPAAADAQIKPQPEETVEILVEAGLENAPPPKGQ